MSKFKLTIAGTKEIENDQAFTITNVRPENNISSLAFTINDYKSKNYIDLLDNFTQIELSLANKNSTYTKTFNGAIHSVAPKMTMQGEVLEVQAWGYEIGMAKTHCNTSYGLESIHYAYYTPQDIVEDIITDYVNKSFAGASTEWDLVNDTEDTHNDLSITTLNSPYLDNFTLINRLADLVSGHAMAESEVGVHWMVYPDKHFYFKKIDADSTDGVWTRYYTGASTTFAESQNIIARDFTKQIDDYANRVILASAFRKPEADMWTEDGGPVWGTSACTATYEVAPTPLVGSHLLDISPTAPAGGWSWAYHPSTYSATSYWDFTKCGSKNNVPKLNFYFQTNADAVWNNSAIILWTDLALFGGGHADAYFDFMPRDVMTALSNKWLLFSVPIGPYWAYDPALQKDDGTANFNWTDAGGDWSEIHGFAVLIARDDTYSIYLDDLHFSGKIIRECYDTSAITATTKERQVFVRLDTALDDTLNVNDNTGTAALLCASELYKRLATPITGTLSVPLKEDMLPGQIIHVHAGKKPDGSFRFDLDMRIKELTHTISTPPSGFRTLLNLTSDVSNTHAPGVPDAWGLVQEYAGALKHGEAGDLKASGVDNLIPRLSWDPT